MTRAISLGLFILAIFCIYQGWFRYAFWENNDPGSGFVPVISGVFLAIFTLNIFVKNGKQTSVLYKKQLYPIIGSFIFLLSVQVIGMILSIAIFMIVWLIAIEKYPVSRASLYGISTTVVIYFIFKVSLNVPLPEGFIGI